MAAATLPEISADYRTFTIRVRPGIFFTPHPSFGGKPRELTAADFAYAFKRIVDPKIRSPGLYFVEGKIEGLDALAKRAQDAGTGLDYDAPVPGLLVVDRHTLRIRLNAPEPIFPFLLTSAVFASLAREVVEAEGETYGQRPVGTGAFAVAAYVPGQRLELARSRSVRSLRWEDLLTSASRAVQPMLSKVRHQVVPPGIDGFIPGYRNPNMYDLATANALLDRVGYRRRPDNYRRNPDGSALTVHALIGTSSDARKSAEFSKRMLDRIGVRVGFETLTSSERLKRMTHCRFGMAVMDWALDVPDGTNVMGMFYSKSIGSMNMSCFADPVFDAAFERALVTPSGPARTELFRTMQTRLDTMAPMRPRPVSDNLLLKRGNILGPFATSNDWIQVITLGVEPKATPTPMR